MSRTWDFWMLNMVVYKVTIVGLWEGKHTQTEIITESHECCFFTCVATTLLGPRPSYRWGSEITHGHTTPGRTLLNKWSTRPRDLSLTAYNNHKRQTPMPPAGFEPTVSASGRPQTQASGRASTSFGECCFYSECWHSFISFWCLPRLVLWDCT